MVTSIGYRESTAELNPHSVITDRAGELASFIPLISSKLHSLVEVKRKVICLFDSLSLRDELKED